MTTVTVPLQWVVLPSGQTGVTFPVSLLQGSSNAFLEFTLTNTSETPITSIGPFIESVTIIPPVEGIDVVSDDEEDKKKPPA